MVRIILVASMVIFGAQSPFAQGSPVSNSERLFQIKHRFELVKENLENAIFSYHDLKQNSGIMGTSSDIVSGAGDNLDRMEQSIRHAGTIALAMQEQLRNSPPQSESEQKLFFEQLDNNLKILSQDLKDFKHHHRIYINATGSEAHTAAMGACIVAGSAVIAVGTVLTFGYLLKALGTGAATVGSGSAVTSTGATGASALGTGSALSTTGTTIAGGSSLAGTSGTAPLITTLGVSAAAHGALLLVDDPVQATSNNIKEKQQNPVEKSKTPPTTKKEETQSIFTKNVLAQLAENKAAAERIRLGLAKKQEEAAKKRMMKKNNQRLASIFSSLQIAPEENWEYMKKKDLSVLIQETKDNLARAQQNNWLEQPEDSKQNSYLTNLLDIAAFESGAPERIRNRKIQIKNYEKIKKQVLSLLEKTHNTDELLVAMRKLAVLDIPLFEKVTDKEDQKHYDLRELLQSGHGSPKAKSQLYSVLFSDPEVQKKLGGKVEFAIKRDFAPESHHPVLFSATTNEVWHLDDGRKTIGKNGILRKSRWDQRNFLVNNNVKEIGISASDLTHVESLPQGPESVAQACRQADLLTEGRFRIRNKKSPPVSKKLVKDAHKILTGKKSRSDTLAIMNEASDDNYSESMDRWNRFKRCYQAIVQNNTLVPDEQVDALVKRLRTDFLKSYTRAQATLPEFLNGWGGNCEAETKLIDAAFLATEIKLPQPYKMGVQVFDDHVQFVIHNTKTKETENVLNGKKTKELEGPIFKREILEWALLNAEGEAGAYNPDDLLIATLSSYPERGRKSGSTNTQLEFPKVNVNSGVTNVPEKDEILFSSNESQSESNSSPSGLTTAFDFVREDEKLKWRTKFAGFEGKVVPGKGSFSINKYYIGQNGHYDFRFGQEHARFDGGFADNPDFNKEFERTGQPFFVVGNSNMIQTSWGSAQGIPVLYFKDDQERKLFESFDNKQDYIRLKWKEQEQKIASSSDITNLVNILSSPKTATELTPDQIHEGFEAWRQTKTLQSWYGTQKSYFFGHDDQQTNKLDQRLENLNKELVGRIEKSPADIVFVLSQLTPKQRESMFTLLDELDRKTYKEKRYKFGSRLMDEEKKKLKVDSIKDSYEQHEAWRKANDKTEMRLKTEGAYYSPNSLYDQLLRVAMKDFSLPQAQAKQKFKKASIKQEQPKNLIVYNIDLLPTPELNRHQPQKKSKKRRGQDKKEAYHGVLQTSLNPKILDPEVYALLIEKANRDQGWKHPENRLYSVNSTYGNPSVIKLKEDVLTWLETYQGQSSQLDTLHDHIENASPMLTHPKLDKHRDFRHYLYEEYDRPVYTDQPIRFNGS